MSGSLLKRCKLSWFNHVYVTIHCRKSYYKEPWIVVVAEADHVNHGRTNIKPRTGQSMSSLLRIADDIGQWATTIAADASVGVANDASASQEIVKYSGQMQHVGLVGTQRQ